MKYSYLLFDADNTLFDFDRAEQDAFSLLSKSFPDAANANEFDIYHEINKKIWQEHEMGLISKEKLKTERFRRYIKRCRNLDDENLACEMGKQFLNFLSQSSVLISGAKEVLASLKTKYSVFIVTNGITKVQKSRLNGSDIAGLVDNIFISEEIGFSKPDKRFFDHVMNFIGEYDPKEYLIIGDSVSSDIEGAVLSGIDSCLYNPRDIEYKDNKATYTVKSLEELINLLM